MNLEKTSIGFGLYSYGKFHPGNELFVRFHTLAAELFEKHRMPTTYISADDGSFTGKLVKSQGRTHKRLQRENFEGIYHFSDKSSGNKTNSDNQNKLEKSDDKKPNQGKLIVDATCTPADIAFPTDLGLLNKAREITEQIIDKMHEPSVGKKKKPRTYRKKARKQYLKVAKQKKPGHKKIRKAIRQQLGYVDRNLKSIKKLVKDDLLALLDNVLYRKLLIISELYRQQLWMYENKSHKIQDRIVSIAQPHIRPIVRGKARTKVEFGAKVSISLVDGFCHCDTINFDSYNESTELIDQIENYKDRRGCYPESVHADQIYRTSKNRKFCKENDIRLSGPALGRPSADKEKRKAIRQQQYQDEVARIPVEGKFGQGKRRFSLGLIMSKLAETSVSTISLTFIVMNLEKILAAISFFAYYLWLSLRQQPKTTHNYHLGLTNMPCQFNENHTKIFTEPFVVLLSKS